MSPCCSTDRTPISTSRPRRQSRKAPSTCLPSTPDQPTFNGGSNLPPAAAAQIYKAKMNPVKGKAKLGAPAVSAGGIESWLKPFAEACNGRCHVGFVPLHFYGPDSHSPHEQATSLKGFLEETIPKVRGYFKDQNMPIRIT